VFGPQDQPDIAAVPPAQSQVEIDEIGAPGFFDRVELDCLRRGRVHDPVLYRLEVAQRKDPAGVRGDVTGRDLGIRPGNLDGFLYIFRADLLEPHHAHTGHVQWFAVIAGNALPPCAVFLR